MDGSIDNMDVEVIVLAAGTGRRMGTTMPKVLHMLAGKPLLQHVLECVRALGPSRCHVVIGYGANEVRAAHRNFDVNWVDQVEQLGTAHAVLQAMPEVSEESTVLVLCGDVPLMNPDSLRRLISLATSGPALLTARVEDPTGYGRVIRDDDGQFQRVVEEWDADEPQRLVDEINTGVLAAPAAWLREHLPQVSNENVQGEYYLPDVLSQAVAVGDAVETAHIAAGEVLGVNDPAQLQEVEREFQYRRAMALLREGTRVADANRLDIRGELSCGSEVSLDLNVLLAGNVRLGDGVQVGANCVLINCDIGPGTEVLPFSHLEGVTTGANCVVGPYARLRPGTALDDGVRIGNFVETKQSRIGAGSKANHLSYIGDSELGAEVNIGAGTITCNYDGENKHRTEIGDRVFVGSNSTLVAPLSIDDDGFIGAGSTVTKPVKSGHLGISRSPQRNIKDWKRPGKKGS